MWLHDRVEPRVHVFRERFGNWDVVDVQRTNAEVRPIVGLKRAECENARVAEMPLEIIDRGEVDLHVSWSGSLWYRE
jgi:hypothetical protein